MKARSFSPIHKSEQPSRRSAAQRKWFADNASIIGYNYVDMTPYFQEAAAKGVITHFPSNVHLTAQGQEVVAVHVWDMLRKLGVTSTQ